MKHLTTIAFAAALHLAVAATARADVRVTMHDGLVTIVASDVTVRQILVEWARVGKVTIVNADRLSGGPVTIELTNVPEKQALDILLRSVSGYLAAPRATAVPNAAFFDRVLVMPNAVQPRSASSSAPAPLQPPQQQRPFQLQPVGQDGFIRGPGQADFEDGPGQNLPNPNQSGEPQRQPVFAPIVPGGRAETPGASPASPPAGAPVPIGTSVPGMILPPPTPPGGQPARF